MSHTTTLKSVKIQDVAAMRAAVAELKAKGIDCDLLENAKPRMYYATQHGTCDYVLKLNKSPYDVGFDKQADGSFVPVFDEWQQKVAGQIGATCPMPGTAEGRVQHQIGQFVQAYAKHAAINQATMQGYIVESTNTDKDGNLHLVLAGL